MNQNNRNLTTILAIVLPLVVLIAIVFIVFCLRRRKNRESNTGENNFDSKKVCVSDMSKYSKEKNRFLLNLHSQ